MPSFSPQEDLNIFYSLHGDASNPPFLLIHGWCCDSTDWSWQIPVLMEKYYLIVPELRGHGHSSAPEGLTYQIEDFASDISSLLRHLNVTKNVIVMGHSMGGITASVLTVLYPEFFKALVIADPPYWSSAATCEQLLQWFHASPNIAEWAAKAFGPVLPPNMPKWMMGWLAIRQQVIPEHVVRKCLEGLYGPGMVAQKEKHAEFVKGKRNLPRLAFYMEQNKVDLEKGLGVGELDEFHVIGDAGHWFMQIKSDEFNEILGKWLEKIERKLGN